MFEYQGVKISWLGHDSFRIKNGKTVIIDPFKIRPIPDKADILLISHEHFDHLSLDDIKKVASEKTTVITIPACKKELSGLRVKEVRAVKPGDKVDLGDMSLEVVPAYNLNKFREPGKPFHPKEDGKVGFILSVKGVRIYHAGDTDPIPEMKNFKTDIALLPVSGTYVMTPEEAGEAARMIKPKLAIPMHYGTIVGSENDAERFKQLAACPVQILKPEQNTGFLRALKATVTPGWLRKHIASKNVVVLDARSRNAFSRARIPGARNADLFHYFVPGTDGKNLKVFQNDLESKLGRLGLRGNERTVVYESGFGMRAARVAWMLEYAGIKSPLILEGGFRAWQDSKYPIEKNRRVVIPTKFKATPDHSVLATLGQVRSLSTSGTGLVLDVRSRGEYDGSEKRECCPRSGRIPGSVWFEWTNFLDKSGGFQSRRSIEKQLRSKGLRHTSDIAVYCHRGARAAAAFYALRSMGYNKARNYVGSWHEWSSKKNLPAEPRQQPR